MTDDLKNQGDRCVYRECQEREHLLDITPSNAPEGDTWSVCAKHYSEVARVLQEDGYILTTGVDTSDVFGHRVGMLRRKEEEDSGHA